MKISFQPASGTTPVNPMDWLFLTDHVPSKDDTVVLPTGDEDQKHSFFVVTSRIYQPQKDLWTLTVVPESEVTSVPRPESKRGES